MKSPFEWDEPDKVMVSIQKINKIIEHPNADRLELAFIDGWQVCVQKDVFKETDLVIYFEIDSVLPDWVEIKIFGEDAKITLSKSRVKTIKIRKMYSQGLIVPISLFSDNISKIKEGLDLTKILEVKKFEEVLKKGNILHVEKKKKKFDNPNFKKVRKPDNIKYFHESVIGKEVIITEKIHGTSFVAGYVEKTNINLIDKLKILIFGKYQFCYRSMSVQLQERDSFWDTILIKLRVKQPKGYYQNKIKMNVYQEAVVKYNLRNIITEGYEITGEIYGDGIQKNYKYGCKYNERKLIVFGVRKDGVNIKTEDAFNFTKNIGLEYVNILFKGILTKDILKECTNGKSTINKKTIKEGCVVEFQEKNVYPVILKSISESYLMQKDLTDFH